MLKKKKAATKFSKVSFGEMAMQSNICKYANEDAITGGTNDE